MSLCALALAIAIPVPFQDPPAAPGPHEHGDHDTFEEALEHRSFVHLNAWREKHPWELGAKIRGYLAELVEVRRGSDTARVEAAQLTAAFLAEALADDALTGWVLSVMRWDALETARYDTLRQAIVELPALAAAGKTDEVGPHLDALRKDAAPPGGWWMCAEDLAAVVESLAAGAAGGIAGAPARERALDLAREISGIAESTRMGELLVWSEGFLGRAERALGDATASRARFDRAIEIARGLPGADGDPTRRPALDAAFRGMLERNGARLEGAGLDTWAYYAVGEHATLVLAASRTERVAKLLPTTRAAIEPLVRRLRQPMDEALAGEDGKAAGRREPDFAKLAFDTRAARVLHEALVRPLEPLLGDHVAIAADAALSGLPFEMLVSGGEAGKEDPARPHAHLRTLRFVAHDRALVYLRRGEIRATAAAKGSDAPASEGPEDDGIDPLWPVDERTRNDWLRTLSIHVTGGKPVIDALRAARRAMIASDDPRGFARAHPYFWAAWVARRR